MKYIKVYWHHSFIDEPTVLYSEIDQNRSERRKVYLYRNGRSGYASSTEATNSVFLSSEPLPLLSEIAADPQFDPHEIEKQEFENIWSRAHLETNNG
jgi:hypothetical protein